MHKRLFLTLIIFILGFSIVLNAEVPFKWDGDAIAIRQGFHIEWQRAGAMDENGNVCYAWSDTRNGDRDVFAQKYDINGNAIWQENGVIVSAATIRQEDPDLIADGFGGFLISWVDFRDDSLGDVWAQRLDSDGNSLWDDNGVLLSSVIDFEQKTLHTMPDGEGGAIVLWHQAPVAGSIGDLYAQHVQHDGSLDPTWPVNGLIAAMAFGDQGGPGHQSVDTDGEGGIIVGWADKRLTGNPNIYAQRISVEGELMWADSSGLLICNAPGEQLGVKIVSDGQGGVYLVWLDKRDLTTNREDLYMQRVDAAGMTQWADNGIVLCDYDNMQELPRIVNDGDNNAVIIWEDRRNDPSNLNSDIYAQKVDPNGNIQWTSNGTPVCTAAEKQYGARVNSSGTGSIVVAWTDDRNGANPASDIYAQRLDSNGNPTWQTDGIIVSDADYLQDGALVRAHSNGNIFVAWQDGRFGSPGIFYQLFDAAGNEQITPGGEEIAFGIDGDIYTPEMIKLNENSGNFLVLWEDYRYVYIGGFLYMQIVGMDTSQLLPFNGKPVAIEYSKLDSVGGGQQDPAAVSDGNNGAIITWEDKRFANHSIPQIYAQRIDSQGNIMWDSSGVQIFPQEYKDQNDPKICSDGSGGAFIAWHGYNDSSWIKVFVAHIDGSGNVTNVNEVTEPDAEETIFGIHADGSGGAVLYWQGGSFLTDYDVFAARVDGNCDIIWEVPLCSIADWQDEIVGDVYNDQYLTAAWSDRRSGEYDLYAQKVDLATGDILWDTDGVLVNDQIGDQVPSDIGILSTGETFIVWQDTRNGLDNDVYMQKISTDGTLMFLEEGLPVAVINGNDQAYPKMIINDNDHVQIVWEDARSVIYTDIYGSHFNSSGELETGWIENGDAICDFFNRQIRPEIIEDYHNGALATWPDARSSGKIEIRNLYAQRWNVLDTAVEPQGESQPTTARLQQNYPNPFNAETIIKFSIKNSGKVKLQVFNSLGQEVATLADNFMSAGSHVVAWNGANSAGDVVSSGFYFYRLEVDNEMKVMKMIMLK